MATTGGCTRSVAVARVALARRRAWGLLIAGAFAAGILAANGGGTAVSTALFADQHAVIVSNATERLDPATNLVASDGVLLAVELAWTRSPDARADGYLLFRSTTSGSGYQHVATITGVSTTAFTDTVPLAGTYHYVLRTYAGSWTSAYSNQATIFAV